MVVAIGETARPQFQKTVLLFYQLIREIFDVICGPMKKMKKLVSSLQPYSRMDTSGIAHPSALKR